MKSQNGSRGIGPQCCNHAIRELPECLWNRAVVNTLVTVAILLGELPQQNP